MSRVPKLSLVAAVAIISLQSPFKVQPIYTPIYSYLNNDKREYRKFEKKFPKKG